jgi:hypothetical protein
VGRPTFDFRTGAASRHPWIEPRNCEPPAPGNDAGEVVAWCRAVGEALNGQQLAAHDAVKHAHHQIKLTAAPATGGNQCINQILRCFDAIDATSARRRGGAPDSLVDLCTGSNVWALLPRDVRHALRDSVRLGDSVRAAVTDLQAVLVRRFLRLCASKEHEEPDSALKDALRVVRGAASREVVRRKALCAALHDAQYKAADGVLGHIPVHKSFWGAFKAVVVLPRRVVCE